MQPTDTCLGVWGEMLSESVEVLGCLVDVALWDWRDGRFPDAALEHAPLSRCLWVRRASYGLLETQRFGPRRCLQFAFREILQHARQYDSAGRWVRRCYSNAKIIHPPMGWRVRVDEKNHAALVAKSLVGAPIPDGCPPFSASMLDSRRRDVIREFLQKNRDLLKASEIEEALHPRTPRHKDALCNVFAVAGRFTA